jgi:hypothetical protein
MAQQKMAWIKMEPQKLKQNITIKLTYACLITIMKIYIFYYNVELSYGLGLVEV